MGQQRLDLKLLDKMAHSKKSKVKSVREQISRKAGRDGISAEAAQIILAKRLGIGTANVFRKLPLHIQQEVAPDCKTGIAQVSCERANQLVLYVQRRKPGLVLSR
jgi:hypothetical protein